MSTFEDVLSVTTLSSSFPVISMSVSVPSSSDSESESVSEGR
jgi:hypothetical protein